MPPRSAAEKSPDPAFALEICVRIEEQRGSLRASIEKSRGSFVQESNDWFRATRNILADLEGHGRDSGPCLRLLCALWAEWASLAREMGFRLQAPEGWNFEEERNRFAREFRISDVFRFYLAREVDRLELHLRELSSGSGEGGDSFGSESGEQVADLIRRQNLACRIADAEDAELLAQYLRACAHLMDFYEISSESEDSPEREEAFREAARNLSILRRRLAEQE
jgi:hypothetical protein